MQVYLINKDNIVLKAEINNQNFDKVIEVYDINYAPLQLFNAYYDKSKSLAVVLNKWFKGRRIPSWRKDLERLLNNLGVASIEELLLKSYGLSLSDCYWIKDCNSNITWKDINFFDNDFEYEGYLEATYCDNVSSKISLISPNNTTDGMISKAWIIDDGIRKLIKGTYTSSNQEPINEYITTKICNRLNIECVNYKIDIYKNRLVSVCDNVLNGNEEFISAYDVFTSKKKDNQLNDYTHYVSILESYGIKDVKKKLSDMYLVDYIMMNYDRHMKNYGVIRDVNTLSITRLIPIFDTGQSLNCDKLLYEMNFNDGKYKFFSNTDFKLSNLLKYINLDYYDLNMLSDIPDIANDTLNKYIMYTDMSKDRINKITEGIRSRINHLIELKENK